MPDNIRMLQQEENPHFLPHASMGLLRVPAGLAVSRELERVSLAVLLHQEHDSKSTISQLTDNVPPVNYGSSREANQIRSH